MDVKALLAPDAEPPLGQRRADILGLLRAARSPVGVREVAGRTGLHPNTARFHLDALVDAGLATRAARARDAPGRPSMAYQAVGGGAPGRREYRLLAEMLASLVAAVLPEPGEAAVEAGREWGRYITERPAPFQRPDACGAVEGLAATLQELGFAPEAPETVAGGADGAEYELRLRQCPFREVAEVHQEVVCQLHLGLMQGALDQMRAPVTADRLQPFAEAGLCVAHLAGPEGPDSPVSPEPAAGPTDQGMAPRLTARRRPGPAR
jgi:predicted ArsR family transcriptional regulator